MCETYLVATENYIPNKSGVDIIELSSNFGFISSEDSKKLQGIVRLRNRHTHDFYQRKLVMKKVITYGTFDLLHYGHINILKRAKEQGDYLIVALSTNEFNEVKGKKCYFSYEERKKLLEAIRYVDLVIPENNWEQKIHDIKEFHVDTFVIGDDWEGKFDFLKEYCKVIYLGRTPEISTTKIKQELGIGQVAIGK